MTINKCRVCGGKFFNEPLLRYENMPAFAQHLPDEKNLKNDKGVALEVCQCASCGLVQLSSEPVPYFREVIRASAFSDEMKKYRSKQFADLVEKYSLRGKKVLEVGCGRGEYLSIMQQCGVKAYGIEDSMESFEQCTRMGLNVSRGFVENADCKLDHAPFDAFFIMSFLEHLPSPCGTLRGIYNNLNDRGLGLVEVPNFDMILQKRLFSEFIGDHLFYFTKATLAATLNLNGFDILECDTVWHEYIISAVVRKRQKLDISDFYEYQSKLKNEINEYIGRFGDKKVAVWGAGHQALAVISLADLKDKIRYVVDSAPFKQGKYTPATHVPIVSSDALRSDPVDAVIVMAASYSDEIVKILKRDFDKNMDIAVLRNFSLEKV